MAQGRPSEASHVRGRGETIGLAGLDLMEQWPVLRDAGSGRPEPSRSSETAKPA